MPMTFRDHVNQLVERFPSCDDHTARTLTWQAFLLVYSEHPWSFLVKEGVISTEAQYIDGTVLLENESTAVVGSGTVWDATWASRRFVGEGQVAEYDITITDATHAVLNRAWLGDDLDAATYRIYRDTYPVPSDCDYGREYFITDPSRNTMVRIKDLGVFLRQKSRGQNGAGYPIWVTRVGTTAAGVPLLRFGPDAPTTVAGYPIIYFAAPQKPANASLSVTPLIPAPYEDLIWRRARWLYAEERGKNLRERDDLRRIYYERFFDAAKAMDGGVEVERYIATIFGTDGGYYSELPWIEVISE